MEAHCRVVDPRGPVSATHRRPDRPPGTGHRSCGASGRGIRELVRAGAVSVIVLSRRRLQALPHETFHVPSTCERHFWPAQINIVWDWLEEPEDLTEQLGRA